jgi:hypothetical protein
MVVNEGGSALAVPVPGVRGRLEMKIKVYVIDFEIPRRMKKWAVRVGIPAALLVGGGVAFAGLPGGYADGQPLTTAELSANFNYLQNEITTSALGQRVPSGFRAHLTGALTTPSGTGTQVVFDTPEYDLGSEYSSGTFTPHQAGIYQIECSFLFAPTSASTDTEVDIEGSGGEITMCTASGGGGLCTASATVELAASSPVFCQVFQNSGSSVTFQTGWSDRKTFSAIRLY